jgi:hypothetical protein
MAKAKSPEGQPHIEYVPLDEVKKWDRNPRTHDDAAIERSIKRYGFVNPLILDERSGKLVAGHGRTAALESMQAAGEAPPARIEVRSGGKWFVPVIRGISFNSTAEAEAYLVADNRLSELGGWDSDTLRDIIRDLNDDGLELDALGWSQAQLDRLLSPEPEKKTRTKAAGEGSGLGDSLAGVASARLLPIYLSAEEYQPTVDRMRAIMDAHRLTDYAALLTFLLDQNTAFTPTNKRAEQSEGADVFSAPD